MRGFKKKKDNHLETFSENVEASKPTKESESNDFAKNEDGVVIFEQP